MTEVPANSADIQSAAEDFLAESNSRIGRIAVGGQTFWVKRPEHTQSVFNRIQKGSPEEAFSRELESHKAMLAVGAPVPAIAFESTDCVVIEDVGQPLETILRFQLLDTDERISAFSNAGIALAKMHNEGISHGRPLLRDICWDGASITFVDFENYDASRNNADGHVSDLMWFVLSLYAQQREELPEIAAAKSAYRATNSNGIWEQARSWARRHRWWDWLSKPIQMRRDPHAREFKAIPYMLDAFLGD